MKKIHTYPPRASYTSRARQQRGITLLVGLVLLLMLTVIGTIGFRNTTLTERMTGNTIDRSVSFQSAESAGREAITAIEAGTVSTVGVGYYAYDGIANAPALQRGGTSSFWNQGAGTAVSSPTEATCKTAANASVTTSFSWVSCAKAVGTKYTVTNGSSAVPISDFAQYVVEVIATKTSTDPVTSAVVGTLNTYRVTSRSTGGSGVAEVILQTVYLKCTGTCT